ncbi:MAG: chorismate synthase [Nitrospirota bacterium]
MLQYLTAGESHGKCLVVIIEGIPANLKINIEEINEQLRERQVGFGRGDRMRIEKDHVEILSGIRHNLTLGSPISLLIPNKDWEHWQEIMAVDSSIPVEYEEPTTSPRPGHADLSGAIKYGHKDLRNVLERASARETAARVAVGAIAKILLQEFDVQLISHVIQIGKVKAKNNSFDEIKERIVISLLRCADKEAEEEMIKLIEQAKKDGDSVGGIFEIQAVGLPIGLGSYTQWDKRLDGRLTQAVMSIPAIKGVEIGLGFESAHKLGSQVHDEIFYTKRRGFFRKTNSAGGLEGGISNGEPIILRAAMKPIPTLRKPLASVNFQTKEPTVASYERSDVCAVPAASVVGEAAVAIELCKAMQEKFAGDSLQEMKTNYQDYMEYVRKV